MHTWLTPPWYQVCFLKQQVNHTGVGQQSDRKICLCKNLAVSPANSLKCHLSSVHGSFSSDCLNRSVSLCQFTPENLFLTIMESQALENHYTAVAGWLLHGTTAAQCIVLVPVTVNIVFMAGFLLYSLVPYLWHVRPATESKCAIINIRMAFSY